MRRPRPRVHRCRRHRCNRARRSSGCGSSIATTAMTRSKKCRMPSSRVEAMGGGGMGGRRQGQPSMSDDERQKMQELVNPANRMTVTEAVKNIEYDVTDDQQRKLTLYTDGRKIQKSKDTTNEEVAAHWDGKQLATDEKSPRGNKMSRTYELSYDGTQLYETLHMTTGRSNTPLSIRYVYDAYGPPPAGAASAPAATGAAATSSAPT